MVFLRNKKFLSVIALAIALTAALWIYADFAMAQQQLAEPKESDYGSAVQALISFSVGVPALAFISAGLLLLDYVAVWLLGWSSLLLDASINLNFTTSPADIPMVQIGWTIFRDIANGLFILIILWVALTIVLNIENLGGRKLLFRVVAAAALINFSLLLVTLIFEFTNLLAEPFVKKLPHENGKIAVATYINQQLESQGVYRDVKVQSGPAIQAVSSNPNTPAFKKNTKDTLLASVGIHNAEAAPLSSIAGCTEYIVNPAWATVCIINVITEGWFGSALDRAANSVFQALMAYTQQIAIAFIYHTLTAATMLVAAIALVVRLFSMIILSIFAPLVFLLYALPMRVGEKYFQRWAHRLGSDAFFAPMFFVLFYLSFRILQGGAAVFLGKGPFPDLNAIVTVVLSLTFMIFAVIFARKAGGAVTETAITLGKGALTLAAVGTAAVATGGTSMALTGTRAGAALGGAVGRLESRPFLGKVTQPLTAKTREKLGEPSERVKEGAKKFEGMAPQTLASMRKAAGLRTELQAQYDLALAKKGRFDLVGEVPAQQAALQRLQRLNLHKEVLEKNPNLITNENAPSLVPDTRTKREAIKKLIRERGADPAEFSKAALEDPEVQRETLLNLEGGTLAKIARKNSAAYGALMQHFAEKGDEITRELNGMERELPGHTTKVRNIITSYREGRWSKVRGRGRGGGRGRREEREEEDGGEGGGDWRESGGYL